MKTAEQWASEIQKFLSDTGWNPGPGWLAVEHGELAKLVQSIQALACRNVPPLPQLRVSDAIAAEIVQRMSRAVPPPWLNDGCEIKSQPYYKDNHMIIYDEGGHTEEDAAFIAHSRQDMDDLCADRETFLRLLHDSEGIDAYQNGYVAGKKESVTADWVADTLSDLNQKQRLEVMQAIKEAYCQYCGCDQLERKCQCGYGPG